LQTGKCRIAFVWHRELTRIFENKDVYSISDRLADRGFEVHLIVPRFDIKNKNENIKVVEIGSAKGRLGAAIWGLKVFRELLKIKPDIVMYMHLYLGHIISGTLYKLARLGKPFIYLKLDYKGDPPKGLSRLFFKVKFLIALLMFDLISIETLCAYKKLQEWAYIPGKLKNKFVIIRNGYNEKTITRNNKQGKTGGGKTIITITRIIPEKGVDVLVDAMIKLREKGVEDAKLIVVGPVQDENYYRALLEKIERHNLDVRFLGFKPPEEISKYYGEADVFALTSYSESFGLTRLEAAASGLPVVTTDTPCREDLEELGFIVVPRGDPDSVAEELYKLITDPNYRESVLSAQAGASRSWNDVVGELLEHISGRGRLNCRL